jgi:MYXO-CTERM domain-containing protein
VRVDGLAQSGIPALAAAALLAVGAWRRRRRYHTGLQRREEQEHLEEAHRAAMRARASGRTYFNRVILDGYASPLPPAHG